MQPTRFTHAAGGAFKARLGLGLRERAGSRGVPDLGPAADRLIHPPLTSYFPGCAHQRRPEEKPAWVAPSVIDLTT